MWQQWQSDLPLTLHCPFVCFLRSRRRNSLAGLRAKVAVAEQAAGDDAVRQQLHAVAQAEVRHAVLRPPVQQRVLHLLASRASDQP